MCRTQVQRRLGRIVQGRWNRDSARCGAQVERGHLNRYHLLRPDHLSFDEALDGPPLATSSARHGHSQARRSAVSLWSRKIRSRSLSPSESLAAMYSCRRLHFYQVCAGLWGERWRWADGTASARSCPTSLACQRRLIAITAFGISGVGSGSATRGVRSVAR